MVPIKWVIGVFAGAILLASYFLTTEAFQVEYRRFAKYGVSGGTYSLTTEEISGWFTNISKTGTGNVTVTFQAFPSTPWCGCNAETNAVQCQVTATTTTSAVVKMWAPSVLLGIANAADSNFGLICVQGAN